MSLGVVTRSSRVAQNRRVPAVSFPNRGDGGDVAKLSIKRHVWSPPKLARVVMVHTLKQIRVRPIFLALLNLD